MTELLALHPLGLLSDDELRQVDCADPDLAEFQEVAGLLALAAAPVKPPARLRSKALFFREEAEGIFVHRAANPDWAPTPFPGVWVKQVAFEPERGMATTLVRMDPGAEYPDHRHTAEEQCYVVSGDIHLGDVVLGAGDYSKAVTGSRHGRIWTEKGCSLLIVACVHDELNKGELG